MPESLKPEEVNNKNDPSVSKQLDTESSLETKTKDLYAIVDGLKIGILGTYRPGVGVSLNNQPIKQQHKILALTQPLPAHRPLNGRRKAHRP